MHQFDRILDALTDKLRQVAAHLDTARAEILAFTEFPKAAWRQIWSNNRQELWFAMVQGRYDHFDFLLSRVGHIPILAERCPSESARAEGTHCQHWTIWVPEWLPVPRS